METLIEMVLNVISQDQAQDQTLSPRSLSFKSRFHLYEHEFLISKHSWAMFDKILLQGKIYITNQRLCFFSIFNNTSLVFGSATKWIVPLHDIKKVETSTTALLYDNAIVVHKKNREQMKFVSIKNRDDVYEVLRDLVKHADDNRVLKEWLALIKKSNSEGEKKVKKEPKEEVKTYSSDEEVKEQIDKENEAEAEREHSQIEEEKFEVYSSEPDESLLDIVHSLNSVNIVDIADFNEFDSKSKHIASKTFKNYSLKTVYHKLYGSGLVGDQSFKHLFVEKGENYDIIEEKHNPEIIDYFDSELDKKLSKPFILF